MNGDPMPSPPRTRPKPIIKATNTPENSRLSKPPRASRGPKPWPRMGRRCPQPQLWPVEPLQRFRAKVSLELFSQLPTPNLVSDKGLRNFCLLFLLVLEYSYTEKKAHTSGKPSEFSCLNIPRSRNISQAPRSPPLAPSSTALLY